ncbi:MAG: hypothetical protein R2799_14250 [Crocinitomicaceae bacterium]
MKNLSKKALSVIKGKEGVPLPYPTGTAGELKGLTSLKTGSGATPIGGSTDVKAGG